MSDLLYVEGLVVSFEGFLALNKLNFIVAEEERMRLLIGPNGAGKTTFFDVLTGRVKPRSGRTFFNDHDLIPLAEHRIAHLGLLRKFQTPSIFPDHTVLENLALSLGSKTFLSRATFRYPKTDAALESVLDEVGLRPLLSRRAGHLSHGEKQWLELAMMLVQNPRLLLLDEPVAGMSKGEKEKTAELLRGIGERRACTILLIEHDMEFVRRVAGKEHKVTVLHEGEVLAEGNLFDVQQNDAVIEAYLGRSQLAMEGSC